MRAIHGAVVSDTTAQTISTSGDDNNLLFYSVSETIDPETGVDSRSGKRFPYWITQLSSLSKEAILFNANQWTQRGLDVNDYIVQTNVTAYRFSSLMEKIMDGRPADPVLVMIDTEGFDCPILQGIAPESKFRPKFILFEHKQCRERQGPTFRHLQNLGYHVETAGRENSVASFRSTKNP
jgi:hypothetical protein